jgi:hypothetical protein
VGSYRLRQALSTSLLRLIAPAIYSITLQMTCRQQMRCDFSLQLLFLEKMTFREKKTFSLETFHFSVNNFLASQLILASVKSHMTLIHPLTHRNYHKENHRLIFVLSSLDCTIQTFTLLSIFLREISVSCLDMTHSDVCNVYLVT